MVMVDGVKPKRNKIRVFNFQRGFNNPFKEGVASQIRVRKVFFQ